MASRFVIFNGRKYYMNTGLEKIRSDFVSVYKNPSILEFWLVYKSTSDFESSSSAMIERLKSTGVIIYGEVTVYPWMITCGSPSVRTLLDNYEWYNDPDTRTYCWYKMELQTLIPGCFEGQYFPGGDFTPDLVVDYLKRLTSKDVRILGISDENYQPTIFAALDSMGYIIDTTQDIPPLPPEPPVPPLPPEPPVPPLPPEPPVPPLPPEPPVPPLPPEPPVPPEPPEPEPITSDTSGLISFAILLIIGSLIYLIAK